MKHNYFFKLCMLFIVLLTACDQTQEGLIVEGHDDNVMMNIMHEMMDEMHHVESTGDPDYDFATMMIKHHEGAIKMAEEELANGTDPQMRSIAQEIMDAQQEEIGMLESFIAGHEIGNFDNDAYTALSMMAMDKMMRAKDLRVLTGNTDEDFASLMIDHHQSAIESSQALLEHGQTLEMLEMAQNIIDAQRAEIAMLQEWLLENKSY